jgi:hypothetical protein
MPPEMPIGDLPVKKVGVSQLQGAETSRVLGIVYMRLEFF